MVRRVHVVARLDGKMIPVYNVDSTTIENHCTRTAQSSRGGCSRQVHKIGYLAVCLFV